MDISKLLSFYMDTSDEDPEYIEEFLRKSGIDFEKSRAKLIDTLRAIDRRDMKENISDKPGDDVAGAPS